MLFRHQYHIIFIWRELLLSFLVIYEEKHNLRFVEVSALDSMNIELSFKDIITAILRKVESAANADNNTSASRGSSTLDIRDKNTVKLKDKNNSKRTCCRGGN